LHLRELRHMMERLNIASTLVKQGAGDADRRRAVHPGWLDQEIQHAEVTQEAEDAARFAAFLQLVRTAGAIDRAATDVLADLDLTAGAFGALLELGERYPGGLAPSGLARKLSVARRTATLYVDILERQGWAERKPHPDDRRMVLARLTSVGRRLLDELGEAYKKRLAELLDDLTSIQAERLRQLLSLIEVDRSRRLEPGAAASTPRSPS
jgi:DNA-binding MarR family transcriptional regulator